MTEFVVIAGLSGAGRSTVAGALEDRGWFVIDNLPTPLIPKVAELATVGDSSIDRVALALGSGAIASDILPSLVELRHASSRLRVVFLEASTDVLVRRYESTKRRHPLGSGESLAAAIEQERELLEPVKSAADVIVDTSELNVHDLRRRVNDLFGDDAAEGMQITLLSFGYKNGLPTDVDMVLDCRFLPNPYWIDELRPLTGIDLDVSRHVLGQEQARRFLEHVDSMLEWLLPQFEAEGKAYLTVAFGCTGGHHRSVAIVEEIASRMRRRGTSVSTKHRDISR